MMYYFQQEEFGGYSSGLIDEANPAPEGAQVVETEKEIDALVKKFESEFELPEIEDVTPPEDTVIKVDDDKEEKEFPGQGIGNGAQAKR